jgi:hypothetical protein
MPEKGGSLQRLDKYTAVMCDYNGIECNRVEVFDRDKPVFCVPVKKFDLEAIQQEMSDEQVSVYLSAFIESLKRIEGLLERARPSGVWMRKN